MITTILFDYYGVFQADVYSNWLRKNGLTRTGEYALLIERFDSGHLTQDDFLNKLSVVAGRNVEYDEIYTPESINQEVVTLIKELKEHNFKVGLLSNASSSLRKKLSDNHLQDLFDYVTISSEVKAAKPDPAIYITALDQLGSRADETLFIDDNPVYVEAAESLGIRAVQFTSPSALRANLQDKAILQS